ncbi:hypothetical protein, partial [Janibacter anophelis]|uniref:hypothetical protein n=1 Tax=Janibacter anophelis TaxID=319054 RepID=UPI0039EE6F3D
MTTDCNSPTVTCSLVDSVRVVEPVWSPLHEISHTYDAVNVYVPGCFQPLSNPQSGVDHPCVAASKAVPVPVHTVLCPSPSDHLTFDTFALAVIVNGPALAVAESDGSDPLPSPTHNHTGTPTVPRHASAADWHGDA